MNEQQTMPLTNDDRLWAMLCHLGGFAFFIIPVVGAFLVPLVIWIVKKNESVYVDVHGREALNFQLSCLIYGVICGLLTLVIIGIFLAMLLGLFWVVMIIVASIKSYDGHMYRYPLTIRFF
jgi:uncharacterized protein